MPSPLPQLINMPLMELFQGLLQWELPVLESTEMIHLHAYLPPDMPGSMYWKTESHTSFSL